MAETLVGGRERKEETTREPVEENLEGKYVNEGAPAPVTAGSESALPLSLSHALNSTTIDGGDSAADADSVFDPDSDVAMIDLSRDNGEEDSELTKDAGTSASGDAGNSSAFDSDGEHVEVEELLNISDSANSATRRAEQARDSSHRQAQG